MSAKQLIYFVLWGWIMGVSIGCNQFSSNKPIQEKDPYIMVLGTAQDAGYPQAACKKSCCISLYANGQTGDYVSSIALIDPIADAYFIIDATPDFKHQIHKVQDKMRTQHLPKGILITHAHIGHYTGLMELGREAIGADSTPVYAMPRMREFLKNNGPWSQLVALGNIKLNDLTADSLIQLTPDISITPISVPHRDEYSETVGYEIKSNSKKVLFIPDIDKWNKWDRAIKHIVKTADIALLDGTFYQDGEISGRNMADIPHPFVQETMELYEGSQEEEKNKIHFIHLNHTNPLLWDKTTRDYVIDQGFNIAYTDQIIPL